jgi:hypothetical protein
MVVPWPCKPWFFCALPTPIGYLMWLIELINIINGINGGQMGDISKLSKDMNEIRTDDLFLDNVTGDLYGFNYETEEWSTKANAGIHCRRAVEEFKTLGKYVIKAPQYKGNKIKEL